MWLSLILLEMSSSLKLTNYSLVYTWKVPNYQQQAEETVLSGKPALKSDHFFLGDGSECSLLLFPGGCRGYRQWLYLILLTEGVVKKVALFAWHVVKRDGSVVLLKQTSAHELGGKKGRFVCLEHGELLHKNEEFLQLDGSLTLQCHICLGDGSLKRPMSETPTNWAKLRKSGKGGDFLILSPVGKEFKVDDTSLNLYLKSVNS
ncbi:MAG: hypothetical protein GY740_04500, partial [Gammaproteobacteria bacterium]|nr:hypothetical protein [Gammaproteobacteria bacterium]